MLNFYNDLAIFFLFGNHFESCFVVPHDWLIKLSHIIFDDFIGINVRSPGPVFCCMNIVLTKYTSDVLNYTSCIIDDFIGIDVRSHGPVFRCLCLVLTKCTTDVFKYKLCIIDDVFQVLVQDHCWWTFCLLWYHQSNCCNLCANTKYIWWCLSVLVILREF